MLVIKNKTIGGMLLVAGTAIGAGMLAFPISTGAMGFIYSSLLFLGCYLFMLGTLFCLLEVCSFTEDPHANLSSVYKERLGKVGQLSAWFLFLFLLYAVAAAYISAGGPLLTQAVQALNLSSITAHTGMWCFALGFGSIVYFGTKPAEYLNRILMVGLFISYALMVYAITPHIKPELLVEGQGKYFWGSIPIVVLAFTSHILLPSLRTYLNKNVKQLKKALFYGSLLPLFFYLLWQLVILGIIPIQGENGLIAIASTEYPVTSLTEALQANVGVTALTVLVGIFSFTALTTSFLAVILGLTDFLMDGLQLTRDQRGRLIGIGLALIPPFLFALYYPKGFIVALEFAGLCVILLYGVLPPLMVWRARYHERLTSSYRMMGGKATLLMLLAGSALVILIEIAIFLGYL